MAIAEVIISLVDGIVAQLTFSVLIVRRLDILHVVVEVCNVVWEDPQIGDLTKERNWMETTLHRLGFLQSKRGGTHLKMLDITRSEIQF